MIVYNLACDQDHLFEGWFGSADDLGSQQTRGLLSCPMCGSSSIKKMVSAPRLNLSSSKERGDAASEAAPASAATDESTSQAMIAPQHAKLQEMIREIVANTEDVGQNFPEEARRIHYKEAPERSIRGVASKKEAQALADEGIAIAQLPFSLAPKSALN